MRGMLLIQRTVAPRSPRLRACSQQVFLPLPWCTDTCIHWALAPAALSCKLKKHRSLPLLLLFEAEEYRSLHSNPALHRFLPKFKKKNIQRKKPLQAVKEAKEGGAAKKKKVYTPFPPPQQPSKIDLQLESGASCLLV